MACGAYGCITGCPRCYGAAQPSPTGFPTSYGGTQALYGAMQPPAGQLAIIPHGRPSSRYGEVDPATAQGFHYSVEQLRQRGLLGEEGAGLLHRGGEVVMPVGGAWVPPEERTRPGGTPESLTRSAPLARASKPSASAATPIGGAALTAFAFGGVATGKLLGSLLRALRR